MPMQTIGKAVISIEVLAPIQTVHILTSLYYVFLQIFKLNLSLPSLTRIFFFNLFPEVNSIITLI